MNCERCDEPLSGKQKKYCSTKCKDIIAVSNWRRELKRRAVEYLGGKCRRCGYDRCISALHFHHRDPSEKDFSFSHKNIKSWERIRAELDKCDLLCANCHAETHEEMEKA